MPEKNQAIVYVGFITYGDVTAKYLPYFLPSLKAQSYKNIKIMALDNSQAEDNDNRRYIEKNYPEIDFQWAGRNLGFAKAYNVMMARAAAEGAQYFFALNPDMVFDRDMVSKLAEAMEASAGLGSASPKVLKWDFIRQQRLNLIDTAGIKLLPGLRFVDIGQGEADSGQYDRAEILGPSGAAAFYRVSALENVKRDGQYFDELMFMYKEDCDLAYRLFLAGYKSRLVADSLAYHDRTVSGVGEGWLKVALNRRHKSRQAKIWSFLNQFIIFYKFWPVQNFKNKMAIIGQAGKMILFSLVFEPYLLSQLAVWFKLQKYGFKRNHSFLERQGKIKR